MLGRIHAQGASIDWRQLVGASTSRRIFAAAVTVGGATAVASLASIARELVVAASFGTSDVLDAFILAFALPTFVVNVIGGSFAAAVVPTFVRLDEQEGRGAAQRLFSGVLALGIALLVIAAGILALLSPVLLPILGSGFGPEKLQLTARLFYLLLPVVVFGGVAALWSSILNAGDRFALAAVSQGLVPLMSAIALLVGGRFGIYALLCGVVGGFALRLALLGAGLTHEGIRLRPCWPEKDPAIRHVIDQYLPMLAGSALLSSTVLVDQAVAATLPPGSVATLAYGTKVVALMTGLGSAALGTAVLPFFARMVAGADWNELRHTLKTFGTLIAVSATLAALVLFVFSDPIVELVFRRGAFTAADALQVATVQAVYALQLPFFGLGIICARLLSSLGGNRMLMWQALICVPINAALDVVLSRAFGAAGIALATSLVYTISLGTLAVMARHVLRRVESQHAASRQ